MLFKELVHLFEVVKFIFVEFFLVFLYNPFNACRTHNKIPWFASDSGYPYSLSSLSSCKEVYSNWPFGRTDFLFHCFSLLSCFQFYWLLLLSLWFLFFCWLGVYFVLILLKVGLRFLICDYTFLTWALSALSCSLTTALAESVRFWYVVFSCSFSSIFISLEIFFPLAHGLFSSLFLVSRCLEVFVLCVHWFPFSFHCDQRT